MRRHEQRQPRTCFPIPSGLTFADDFKEEVDAGFCGVAVVVLPEGGRFFDVVAFTVDPSCLLLPPSLRLLLGGRLTVLVCRGAVPGVKMGCFFFTFFSAAGLVTVFLELVFSDLSTPVFFFSFGLM